MGSPMVGPSRDTGGRPRTKARLAPGAPPATTVAAVAAGWPAESWPRFAVAEGEKGPRLSERGRARIIERRDRLPGPEVWLLAAPSMGPLLARRSLSDPNDIAYDLALAPTEVTLQDLASVSATRSTAEPCLEEAKEKTGLDQHQVRHRPSRYRHLTRSMPAHAWPAAIRHRRGAKGGVPPA